MATRIKTEPQPTRKGVLPRIIDPNAWVLGDGNLGAPVLQPDGQWDAYLPAYEDQIANGYDPADCVSEAYTTCQEILERRLFGTASEYSQRFLAQISGTQQRGGNDLHTVAEFGRKVGLVPETEWPSAGIHQDEFYAPPPARLFGLAANDHQAYVREHDDVPATKDAIILALRSSPLSFSIYAWTQKDGIYYEPDGVQDNHCPVIYGYTDEYVKVFDSTNPFLKQVAWDAIDGQVKRYTITKRAVYEAQLGIFAKIFAAILAFLSAKPTAAPQIQPVASQEPVTPTPAPSEPKPAQEPILEPRVRLYNAAYKMLGKDASPTDKAPDELACAESVNEIYKSVFGEYIDQNGTLSTTTLYRSLRNHIDFMDVSEPLPGDIIISPTGTSSIPGRIGHVGIVGKNHIMSNNSTTGTWEADYTLATWKRYFSVKNGFPVYFFRRT